MNASDVESTIGQPFAGVSSTREIHALYVEAFRGEKPGVLAGTTRNVEDLPAVED